MPKFNVTLTRVTTVVYDDVEIEAETQQDAERMVTEMVAEVDEEGDTMIGETSNEEIVTAKTIIVAEA